MKILLTGKNGQVGFELHRALAPLGIVYAVDVAECNLADEQSIRQLVQRVRPDVIVNSAAYTAVDKADSEPEIAHAVNAKAPGIVGEEAEKIGAWVIHFSTDYVFFGTKDGAYYEDDITNPQSVYGRTKRDGELALQASGARHLIFRTSRVVGAHGGNFAKTRLRLAADSETLSVVADQYGAPTSAALLADVTSQFIRQLREGSANFPYGTYHLVAGGETNWCDYARYVIDEAIKAGVPMKATPERVTPIAIVQYPTPASRPANSRLDAQRFRQTFDLKLPHWQDGLSHILQQIL